MTLEHAPLGKSSEYPDHYAPELLFPVPRQDNRARIGFADGRWPWFGEDLWQAWEVSWLRLGGVPEVAWATIRVPAASPNIIESKSLKLYLNSLNQEVYSSAAQVQALMVADLSSAAGAQVSVDIHSVDEDATLQGRPAGFELIDTLPLDAVAYDYDPNLLTVGEGEVTERLCSHLLKSNCPVTGQPDWASLLVEYRGRPLSREGLLRYVVGFRQQQDFHEHCVETIFRDLMAQCQPAALTVCARYTRRGGLDINPWRSTEPGVAPRVRLVRQ